MPVSRARSASTCQPVCGAMPWTSTRVRTVPLLPRRAAARSLSILPLAFDAFHRIPVIVPSPARVLCVCLSDTGQAEREFGEAGQNLRVSLSEDDPRVDDLLLRPESHSRADADHPLAQRTRRLPTVRLPTRVGEHTSPRGQRGL